MKADQDLRVRQLERALAALRGTHEQVTAQAQRRWHDLSRMTRDLDSAVAKCREAERRADVAEDTARELQGQLDRAIAQRDEARAQWQAIDDEPGRTIKAQEADIASLREALQRMVDQCWRVYCHACAEVADTLDGHAEHCTVPDAVRALAGQGAPRASDLACLLREAAQWVTDADLRASIEEALLAHGWSDDPEGPLAAPASCLQCGDPECPGSPLVPHLCTMRARACRRFVAEQLEGVRAEARELGYALAVHGSLTRDVDIVAVPWTDDAAPAELLVDAVVRAVDGSQHTDPDPGKERPHGRRSWSIVLPGFGNTYLDVSVMPREDPFLADRLKATQRHGCGECARDTGMLEYVTQALCSHHADELRDELAVAREQSADGTLAWPPTVDRIECEDCGLPLEPHDHVRPVAFAHAECPEEAQGPEKTEAPRKGNPVTVEDLHAWLEWMIDAHLGADDCRREIAEMLVKIRNALKVPDATEGND